VIKFIKTYLDQKSEAKQVELVNAKAREIKVKANWIKEIKDLRLITINNVRYINSSINTISGVINHAKGANAADTNRKRKFLRNRLAWLTVKQSEEEGMTIYYDSLLKKI